MQYTFDGYLHMIFANQDFDVLETGFKISGKTVLEDVFGQQPDVNAWGMFGVLVAWILFFRFVHYVLFLRASLPFLKTDNSVSRVSRTLSKGENDSELDNARVYEMVTPHVPVVEEDLISSDENA